MGLTTKIDISLEATATLAQDLGTLSFPLKVSRVFSLADGTGADQANQVFSDTRSLAASGSEDLDLAGGLSNAFGQTLTFSAVKALLIKASSSNAHDLKVGGAATNAFASWVGDATDVLVIKPGGALLLVAPDADGYAVTVDTGDVLTVANGGAVSAISYDIVIVGVATVA